MSSADAAPYRFAADICRAMDFYCGDMIFHTVLRMKSLASEADALDYSLRVCSSFCPSNREESEKRHMGATMHMLDQLADCHGSGHVPMPIVEMANTGNMTRRQELFAMYMKQESALCQTDARIGSVLRSFRLSYFESPTYNAWAIASQHLKTYIERAPSDNDRRPLIQALTRACNTMCDATLFVKQVVAPHQTLLQYVAQLCVETTCTDLSLDCMRCIRAALCTRNKFVRTAYDADPLNMLIDAAGPDAERRRALIAWMSKEPFYVPVRRTMWSYWMRSFGSPDYGAVLQSLSDCNLLHEADKIHIACMWMNELYKQRTPMESSAVALWIRHIGEAWNPFVRRTLRFLCLIAVPHVDIVTPVLQSMRDWPQFVEDVDWPDLFAALVKLANTDACWSLLVTKPSLSKYRVFQKVYQEAIPSASATFAPLIERYERCYVEQ
jgi:hypothetical protein